MSINIIIGLAVIFSLFISIVEKDNMDLLINGINKFYEFKIFYPILSELQNDSLTKYQDTLELYDKALKIDPDNSITLANKGIIFVKLGKFDKAIELFDKSLESDPKNVASLFYKAISLEQLGYTANATIYYKRAVEINPNYIGELVNAVETIKEQYKISIPIEILQMSNITKNNFTK